ncbi:MAG: hypothetical protein DMF56_06170 [Acidobacteria bacterium]|nr:MAG: hypothetical protein DMF56_06170 [Acidobacteriota bacterium]
MELEYRKIRVFVASPSDVTAERESLATVINELNSTVTALVPQTRAVIELVRWETHARPAAGRPQAIITEQIGPYDIFIGIMWKRFGTATGRALSGTEEEFRLAFKAWKSTRSPQIMFYFSAAPSPPPSSTEEVKQLARVVRFRSEIAQLGIIWQYESAARFAEVVRPHLVSVIGKLLSATGAPTQQIAEASSPPPKNLQPRRAKRPAKRKPKVAAKPTRTVSRNLTKGTITVIGPEDAFFNRRSDLVLMAGEALADHRAGRTSPLDPDHL